MFLKLILLFLALGVILLITGSQIRQGCVDEEFINEQGKITIRTTVYNQKRYKAANFIYLIAAACFLTGIILAFYYDVYL